MKRVISVWLFANAVMLALAAGLLLQKRMEVVHAEGGGAVPLGNGDVNGDGQIDLSDAVYLLVHLFLGGPAVVPIECPPPVKGNPFPATGQTECYGNVEGQGWVVVPCDSADYPGQDGFYQAGCPSVGRFVDNGDRTVTDTCTKLEWQKDTADVNGSGAIETDFPGDLLNWQASLQYCEGLSFAGHDDWRLPNVRELQSIVDYGRWDPAIDPVFGAVSFGYWSSSAHAYNTGGACVVDFYNWDSGYGVDRDDRRHVRAVRNAP